MSSVSEDEQGMEVEDVMEAGGQLDRGRSKAIEGFGGDFQIKGLGV